MSPHNIAMQIGELYAKLLNCILSVSARGVGIGYGKWVLLCMWIYSPCKSLLALTRVIEPG